MPQGIYEVDCEKEKARYEAYRELRRTLGQTMEEDADDNEAVAALQEAAPAPDTNLRSKYY
jgi:hypothetical protein